MIKEFFTRRARRRRELRSQLAGSVLQRLERENSLTVDDALISKMGVGRREFFRTAYEMVIQERMHMMAQSDGCVVLMSNAEFHRFMMRRSGMRETEIRRRADTPVFTNTLAEHAFAASEEETVWVDSVAAEFAEPATVPESAFIETALDHSALPGFVPAREDETLDPLPAFSGTEKSPSKKRFAENPALPSGFSGDLDWFSLEIAPDTREKMPDMRQGLPERRREAWAVSEESEVNFD